MKRLVVFVGILTSMVLVIVYLGCAQAAATPTATARPAAPAAATATRPPAATPTATPVPPTPTPRPKEKVSIRMSWAVEGSATGAELLVAVDKGWFAEEGLDVEVLSGTGSGSTANLVATGAQLIGEGDMGTMALTVDKGAPLVAIAALWPRSPVGVFFPKGSPITKPKDIEGKSVILTAGTASGNLWPAFVAANNLDKNKITELNVSSEAKVATMLAGKGDTILGFTQSEATQLEKGGMQLGALMFSDWGVNTLNSGIFVSRATLEQKPDMLRRFIKAAMKGIAYGPKNIKETAAIAKKYYPNTDIEAMEKMLEKSVPLYYTKNSEGKPLGWMAKEDWQQTIDILAKYGGLKNPQPVDTYYTNKFVE